MITVNVAMKHATTVKPNFQENTRIAINAGTILPDLCDLV